MKPADIGKAYNTITHLWEGEKFASNNGIAQHRRAIAFVEGRGRALDVGCGCTGRIIDLLLEEGFKPEGIDISDEMIRLAQRAHPAIEFYKEDICEWTPAPASYDFISAWDSIWHVPLARQGSVINSLISGLRSNGVLIFSCGGTDSEDDHIDDAMGPEVYYSTLGVSGFLTLIMERGCICRHFEYDQYPQLHSYFIVQKG